MNKNYKIYEDDSITCIKENEFGLKVGTEYGIGQIDYDNGDYSEVHFDNGSNKVITLPISTVEEIFELPYSFEVEVIDTILNLIKDNQEYLTQPENLPQLAKLGYMYNILWYSGRVCYGYEGIIKKGHDCDDNPKYKIEMCDPINDKIDNLIYSAWGMHVSNDLNPISYEDFIKLLFEKRELTEWEKKMLKDDKTFDEWVEILTHEEYKYTYKSRKAVANALLCTLGAGYSMNSKGFIVSSMENLNPTYGDWENAKFRTDIENVVKNLVALPIVKKTFNTSQKYAQTWIDEKEREEKEKLKRFIGIEITQEELDSTSSKKLWDKIFASDKMDELINNLSNKINKNKKALKIGKKYNPYYPISSSAHIDVIINKNSKQRMGIKKVHQSYVDESIKICKDILEHQEEENKQREGNVKFAKKFLALHGFDEYKEFIPKYVDYDAIMEKIKDNFSSVTYNKLHLNDTRTNQYADDNAYVTITKPDETMRMGVSTDIEFIKGSNLYNKLKLAIEKTKNMSEVYHLSFFYENTTRFNISINIILNEKYLKHNKDKAKYDQKFVDDGFMIGDNIMAKPLNNYIMVTKKSETLGSTHPDNKEGKDYYSMSKYFHICDKNWKVLLKCNIDERNFNTFTPPSETPKNNDDLRKLKDLLIVEHRNLKLSDPAYGKKGAEGKRSLYGFEFMNWMESKHSRKAKLKNLKNGTQN